MFLENYRHLENSKITFTRQQASNFAKNVAGDFNPIHDITAKRFCVPGDLLFACAIEKYGVSNSMCFTFAGMVGDGIALNFPAFDDAVIDILDENEKKYLSIEHKGDNIVTGELLQKLTCAYVEFSGQTFPHVLVPLMEKHNVMINPARPLVIYEKMSIELETINIDQVHLELDDVSLDVNGKRGDAILHFNFISEGKTIGKGRKNMVLSGLREYHAEDMQGIIDQYEKVKADYLKA